MTRPRRMQSRGFQKAALRFKEQVAQLGPCPIPQMPLDEPIPEYSVVELGWIVIARKEGFVAPYVYELYRLYKSTGLEDAVKEMAIDPLVRVGGLSE